MERESDQTFVDERESDQRCCHFLCLSVKERESGREVENKRWQIESLVTNVPRHLRVAVAFLIISRLTVARGTIVHSATSHSAEIVV